MEEHTLPTPLSSNHHSLGLDVMNSTVTLPVDALTNVCEQLGSFSATKNVVMLKHEANRTILALSSVCKSWRYHVFSYKSLFRNIAFDISSDESIGTAGVFLKLLRGTVVPINVYARLGQSLDPDPMISRLFAQLRLHAPQIVHFEYNGDIARYRSYLDHPTPNLLFFSDNFDTDPGRGPPLFCGQMPRLRVLTTLSKAPQTLWATSTLSELTTLNLGFMGSDLHVPLSSFLNLLRGSPRLESLYVQAFTPTIDPTEDLEEVFLPFLCRLNLHHNEFHTLVKHLRTPAVRQVFYVGESHAVSGGRPNPTFGAPHLFATLPLLPMFEQPIKSVHLKTTGNEGTDASFCLQLTADGGFILRVLLYWILDSVPLFDNYIKRSVLELAGMMDLAPGAQVELFHEYLIPSDNPIYQPLLLFTEIDQLTIKGDFAIDVLKMINLRTGVHHLLPHLKLLTITDWASSSGVDGRMALLSCLKSRAVKSIPFSVRLMDMNVCNVDFGVSGCTVERDSDDPRFVVITFSSPTVESDIGD